MRGIIVILALLAVTPVNAQNQGPQRGIAQEREAHERKLQRCMVELSTIQDPDLRRWCEAQSRRLP